MISFTLANKKLELYDSIDLLPMHRYHVYNKMLLIDSAIGSDLTALDQHLSKVIAFISRDDKESAQVELENLRMNIYFVHNNISPRHMAFIPLIYKIDGKENDDLTDNGIKKTLELFRDVTQDNYEAALEAVKKKNR